MAILVALAEKIANNRPDKGSVAFLFQAAEEVEQGARDVVLHPNFSELNADYLFALHNIPGIAKDSIIMKRGSFAAASKGMTLVMEGKTAHAAELENGISPASAIAKIIKHTERLNTSKDLFMDLCFLSNYCRFFTIKYTLFLNTTTGLYLLFKVIGVVSISMLVLMNNKKTRFNMLLYSNVLLSVLFSFAVVLADRASFLPYIFMLGGVIVSLYIITMNGVLLEISGNENRALYTGFAGAGNILPMLFPLVAGGIIERWGYISFFAVFAIVVSLSAFFIYKIKCKK